MAHQNHLHLAFSTLGQNHEARQEQPEKSKRGMHVTQLNKHTTNNWTHPTHKESKMPDIYEHHPRNSKQVK